jgi:hypothetical protein
MSLTVSLATRAEKKEWVRTLDVISRLIMIASVFSLFLARVLDKAAIFYWLLTVLVAAMCAQIGLALLGSSNRARIYYPKSSEAICLSEHSLSIGTQEISIDALKSIVVESNGYAGQMKPSQRSPHSGNGKVTIVYKGTGREAVYSIVINSGNELKILRQLSESWRKKGKTAFIMD